LSEFAALDKPFSVGCGAAGSHGIKEVFHAMASFSDSGNIVQVRTFGLLIFLEK